MDTVTILTLLQIVAIAVRKSPEIIDLIERAKRGEVPSQEALDAALAKVKASAAKWNEAANG